MLDNGLRSSCVASAMYSLFRMSSFCSSSRASASSSKVAATTPTVASPCSSVSVGDALTTRVPQSKAMTSVPADQGERERVGDVPGGEEGEARVSWASASKNTLRPRVFLTSSAWPSQRTAATESNSNVSATAVHMLSSRAEAVGAPRPAIEIRRTASSVLSRFGARLIIGSPRAASKRPACRSNRQSRALSTWLRPRSARPRRRRGRP